MKRPSLKSNWWPLVNNLVEFLNAQAQEDESGNVIVDANGNPVPLFQGVDVYAGSKGKTGNFPRIEVTWDEESNLDLNHPNAGTLVLGILIGTESPVDEPTEAYAAQADLQDRVLCRLRNWPRYAARTLGIIMNITLDGIKSDGDIYRPVSLSAVVLDIDWKMQGA